MKRPSLLAKLLLFFSGLSALVYQTIWIKQLTLVVGVDVYAITTGVSGFFAGLAIGSALFGKMASRSANPLRLYAGLEIGIALLGVLSTLLLFTAPQQFVSLSETVGPLAWILPFVLLAVPAMLMGGTLPPLLAFVHPGDDAIGRSSGSLYAANTAGAIAGTLIAVFMIIPEFGIRGSAFFAAGVNLVLAGIAFVLSRSQVSVIPQLKETLKGSKATLALTLYALSGGVALGYEVVWTQVIVQFLSTRAMAFSVVLATYLTGLVIGSALIAKRADRVRSRWTLFGVLIIGAGLLAMLSFLFLGPWLPEAQKSLGSSVLDATNSRMAMMAARFSLAAAFIILPATLLLGAAFPAAARLTVLKESAGRDVGLVLALNTAMGIAGTLITGFVLIPWLGLAGSLGTLACCAALIGSIALVRSGGYSTPSFIKGAVVMAGMIFLALNLPDNKLAILLARERSGKLTFYQESPGGTVAVIEQQAASGPFSRLYIQGVSNTGDGMPSRRYMRLQALTPVLIHPGEPKSALVIALGTGITAGALSTYPGLERRLCVELLEPVRESVPFFKGNYQANADPGMEIRIADGRHELMRSEETFDVITLEPPPPAARGVVNLYSTNFYQLARTRLNPGGVLAQWLPITTQNYEDSQSLVRSMLDAFPYVSLWTTEIHEMMLIGSEEPLDLNYDKIDSVMQTTPVGESLSEVGIDSAADLLATFITDREGLETFAADALSVTDNRPRIEYAGWVRPKELLRVLPPLLELRKPPVVDAKPEQKQAIEHSFYRLGKFYEIALWARSGDMDIWQRETREFLRDTTPNAYYDFIFGR